MTSSVHTALAGGGRVAVAGSVGRRAALAGAMGGDGWGSRPGAEGDRRRTEAAGAGAGDMELFGAEIGKDKRGKEPDREI